MEYYIYRHIRLDTNEPFYIGMAKKYLKARPFPYTHRVEYKRAYQVTDRQTNKIWTNIAQNTAYSVEILFETNDRDIAHKKEEEFILLYGRIDLGTGCLANQTDGGKGTRNVSTQVQESRNQNRKWYKVSDETKKKQSEARKGIRRGLIGADHPASKPILQYDLHGVFIKEFTSPFAVRRELGFDNSTITRVAKGLAKSSYGFIWKFKSQLQNAA